MFLGSDKDLRKAIPKKAVTKPAKSNATGNSTLLTTSSVTNDTDDIVEKAKIEREQRILKRELSVFAVKIQAWWRGKVILSKSIKTMLGEFESKMNDVEKLNKVLISKGAPGLVAPCNVCTMLWNKLYYILRYSRKDYVQQVGKYCQFLLIPVLSQLDTLKNIMPMEYKRDNRLWLMYSIFNAIIRCLGITLTEISKRKSTSTTNSTQSNVFCEALVLLLGQGEPFKIKYTAELAKSFESFRNLIDSRSGSILLKLRECLLGCTVGLLANKLPDDTDASSKKAKKSLEISSEIINAADKLFDLCLFCVSVDPSRVNAQLTFFASYILSIPVLTCVLSSDCLRKFCDSTLFPLILNLLAFPDSIDFQTASKFHHVINCYQWTLGNLISFISYISPVATDNITPAAVNDSLLETYLNVCHVWVRDFMIPGVLQGKEGIIWRKTGASMTAVAVPSALEDQVLNLLNGDVLRALNAGIIANYDINWIKYINAKDTKEIEEALSSSGYIVARNALVDQQAAATWFTSKWAQKVSTSIQKSFSISSLLPSFFGGSSSSTSTSANSKPSEVVSIGNANNVSLSEKKINSSINPTLLCTLCSVWSLMFPQISAGGVPSDSIPGKAINYLAFSSHCVDKLWMSLLLRLGSNDVVKMASKFNCNIDSTNNVFLGNNNEFNILMTIVAVMRTTLIALDDSELYDQQKPLPLHQILQLVRSLKIILYKMIQSEPNLLLDQFLIDDLQQNSNGSSSPSRHSEIDDGMKNRLMYRNSCAKVVSAVLSDLYARWARRPFSMPTLWEIDEANSSSVKYEIQSNSPLGVSLLRTMPWSIDFHERMKIFRATVDHDRLEVQGSNDMMQGGSGYRTKGQIIRIRKARILEDGMDAMNKIGGTAIKDRIVVRYVNDFGEEEAGIDIGGLFKDFVTDLSTRIFDPNYGLFCLTSSNLLYPNPAATLLYDKYELDKMYLFLGRVLGKALFENITLQPQFAHFFLAFMHGKYNFMRLIDDLATLDPELYKNLMFLKSYEGDIGDLSLTFSITDTSMGLNKEIELIPGGSNVFVSSTNRYRYVNLVAKYYLHDRLKQQAGAFFSGLYQVISPLQLGIFCAPELQILISGAQTGIDILDLQRHCRYAGGYVSVDRYMTRFWAIFEELSVEDRALLVKFVTSCERPPSLGFAALHPPFTIQKVDCADDSRLPTASTCFNILKLPTYSTQKIMKDKLLLAIRSKSGFDLS